MVADKGNTFLGVGYKGAGMEKGPSLLNGVAAPCSSEEQASLYSCREEDGDACPHGKVRRMTTDSDL